MAEDIRLAKAIQNRIRPLGPLFIHQLSHCWLDFRGIVDGFMQARRLDYFENSRRALRVQQSYAGESETISRLWTALLGCERQRRSRPATKTIDNVDRVFWMYEARGVPDGPDDGTLAPAPSRRRFRLPEPSLTRFELVRAYPNLRSEYGLRASLNPTFGDWVSPLNYGLDQGPIVMMIENHRTSLLWNLMRRCPYIWRGLRKAGFAGGWLESEREPQCPQAVEGTVARAGAIQQVVREYDARRTIDPHPTATMLAARIHSYGDPTGVKIAQAPDPAGARTGSGPRESSWREPAGLDGRRRQGSLVARPPPAADIGLGAGWNRREVG